MKKLIFIFSLVFIQLTHEAQASIFCLFGSHGRRACQAAFALCAEFGGSMSTSGSWPNYSCGMAVGRTISNSNGTTALHGMEIFKEAERRGVLNKVLSRYQVVKENKTEKQN